MLLLNISKMDPEKGLYVTEIIPYEQHTKIEHPLLLVRTEFEKHFREHLERSRIKHFWNYPKHPQLNAKVERFNRTVQEEFLEWNSKSLFHDLESFNHKLVDWLIFYNTKRPHFSLGNIPPVKYLIQKVGFSNMLWTHTLM